MKVVYGDAVLFSKVHVYAAATDFKITFFTMRYDTIQLFN